MVPCPVGYGQPDIGLITSPELTLRDSMPFNSVAVDDIAWIKGIPYPRDVQFRQKLSEIDLKSLAGIPLYNL